MRISPTPLVLIPVLFPLTSFTLPSGRAAFAQSGPQDCGHRSKTVLRLANSDDGLNFSDSGQVFLRQAASPDLIRLPNGHLLAIFEHCPGAQDRLGLYVARSTDSARSWSETQPIVLRGPGAGRIQPDRPALAMMRDRSLRVYFRMRDPEAAEGQPTIIGSAVTRNGWEYEYDRRTQIRSELSGDVHLCAAWIGRRLHLYVVSNDPAAEQKEPAVEHWISNEGKQFYRASRTAACPGVMEVLPAQNGAYRVFVTAEGGIGSLLTPDGGNWRAESGVRIISAAQPSVVRTEDGKFLMLYVRSRNAGEDSLREIVASTAGATQGAPAASQLGQTAAPTADGGNHPNAHSADAQTGVGNAQDLPGWEPFQPAGNAADGNSASEFLPSEDIFPPKPDFVHRINYLEWAQQNILVPAEGNAHDAYASFCAMPGDAPGTKPLWPAPETTIDDMFNGTYSGTPFAWDAAQYPNWEATRQTMQPLVDKFREATQFDVYAMPLLFTPQQYADAVNGEPFLYEFLLPSLSQHRKLVRLTLADAWRAESGQLSPEKMITNWGTALRGASHMLQGVTLIHHLVGVAEQAAIERTARWALASGTFSEPQLEAALNALGQHDRPAPDPANWVAFESASAMQVIQSLVKTGPDGQPQIDMTGLKRLRGLANNGSQSDLKDDLAITAAVMLGKISVPGLREDADTFDAHMRRMAGAFMAGYPQKRASDLRVMEEEYIKKAGPVGKMFAPSLARAYVLISRNEAERRATQLAYALKLYQVRNGSWPSSLEALGTDCSYIRTDPFTGRDFGYQLTAEGPKVYSLSENARDDGGVHSKTWDDAKSKEAGISDDYVFWPPQE